MMILKAITDWITCASCRKPRRGSSTDERSPLLNDEAICTSEPSLTAGYTSYLESSSAIRLFIIHGIIYYAAAVILFSFVLDTKWTVIDSLYFATILFTTIGYGDIFPQHQYGQIFTIFLAIYGIIILGIFLGIYGEALLDNYSIQDTKQKASVQTAVLQTIAEQNNEGESAREPTSSASQATGAFQQFSNAFSNGNGNTNSTAEIATEAQRTITLWDDIGRFLYLQAPILIIVLLIGIGIGQVEGWTIIQSLYWTVVTGTTIGLGDEAPTNQYVRLFCVFFLPFCVAVLGESLSRIAGLYLRRKQERAQQAFFDRSLTLADIETMDTDKDGAVSKAEFLCYMLVALQRVEQDDLTELLDLFEKLDKDKTGVLHKNDLETVGQSINAIGESSVRRGSSSAFYGGLSGDWEELDSTPTTNGQRGVAHRVLDAWRHGLPSSGLVFSLDPVREENRNGSSFSGSGAV